MVVALPACPVCGLPSAWTLIDGKPCMACIRARQKAALFKRCVCPPRLRQETEPHQIGSRRWTSCDRCLGPVRQLS